MTVYLLSILAMWLLWTLGEVFLVFPKWCWYLAVAVLGVGAQVLVERKHWYLGIGLGGATVLLYGLTDLLLVLTDLVMLKVGALRNRRG